MDYQEESRPDILQTGVSGWSDYPDESAGESRIGLYENWPCHG
ncbi:hypothetical protein [Desulforamulus reducens]|nr:hypothetical protein [Desulforamulus reducens]